MTSGTLPQVSLTLVLVTGSLTESEAWDLSVCLLSAGVTGVVTTMPDILGLCWSHIQVFVRARQATGKLSFLPSMTS